MKHEYRIFMDKYVVAELSSFTSTDQDGVLISSSPAMSKIFVLTLKFINIYKKVRVLIISHKCLETVRYPLRRRLVHGWNQAWGLSIPNPYLYLVFG